MAAKRSVTVAMLVIATQFIKWIRSEADFPSDSYGNEADLQVEGSGSEAERHGSDADCSEAIFHSAIAARMLQDTNAR